MAKYITGEQVISAIQSNDVSEINKCSRHTIFSIVRNRLIPKHISVYIENHLYEIYEEMKEEYEG